MQIINIKRMIGVAVLLSAAGLTLVSGALAQQARDEIDLPTLPCSELQVPLGNRVTFHAYALGVQMYRWNGASWVFVEPVARLFANDNFKGEVGVHYVGPTWESNSGSKVVASRVAGCSADATAIDWLLLEAVSTEGHGPFRRVTYIQRGNKVGGRPPVAPGSAIGTVVEVPYTAQYYFYRAQN